MNRMNLEHLDSEESLLLLHTFFSSPDGQSIVSSDDSGNVCVWGQNKSIIR